jgi:hypothetical protein
MIKEDGIESWIVGIALPPHHAVIIQKIFDKATKT